MVKKTIKKEKTKEDFFSLMEFMRNALDLESVLYCYDISYSILEDFDIKFFKHLEKNHLMTSQQRIVMSELLRDKALYSINDFMDIMVKDYNDEYSDISTLNLRQFESILCQFFEEYQEIGDSLFEDIKTHVNDVDWDYLLKFVPDAIYEEPPVQNDEYSIKLKDLEFVNNPHLKLVHKF